MLKIKHSYQSIIFENKDIKVKNKELKDLIKQAQKLISENEDLLNEIGRVLSTCENEKIKSNITQKLERARKINY